jgi:branched-chain amino acid transport system ATP-binding protein
MQNGPEKVLELVGLSMSFGGLKAVSDLSMDVARGEIVALIGPNGAGKTTVFNCVTGVLDPVSGRVMLESKDITGRKPHSITRSGVGRTFQNIRLFPNMTALENVLVGADAQSRSGVPGALLRTPRQRREEREAHARATELLKFVGIERSIHSLARNLPYGDQRRLEIARAMATRPRLLLLDEPAAGMNPAEKQALMGLIREIRDSGLTILLIEHDMKVVMGISERIVVLNFGVKIAEGTPGEVQRNPEVIAAYLGEPSDAA